jgi:hypothetical protein
MPCMQLSAFDWSRPKSRPSASHPKLDAKVREAGGASPGHLLATHYVLDPVGKDLLDIEVPLPGVWLEHNALLLDKTIAYARAHRHPEFRDQTIWEAFEAERSSLVPYAGRFDGFHGVTASVSKTCLVRFDNNKYSVMASAVGRPVEIRAYADRIELRQDGRQVGEHPRIFGRDQTVYDPWHYVPVLARKPGAWRNGAPFKDWVLPARIEKIRRRLGSATDGGQQMVTILTAVLSDGLPAVEAACAEALREGVCSADIVLNILARQREPRSPVTILNTPQALRLRIEPTADCSRYDSLRRAI